MWNAVLIYNLWVMENLGLLDKTQEVPQEYQCCEPASRGLLAEIDAEKKLLQSKKYPAWSRASNEMPKRTWLPKPIETLNALGDLLKAMVVRMINNYLKSGYDPPWQIKRKRSSS